MYPCCDLFISGILNFVPNSKHPAPPFRRILNKWLDADGVRRPLFSTSPSSLCVCVCVIFSTHANPRPRPLPFVRRRVEKKIGRRWKNAVTPPGQREGGGFANRTVVIGDAVESGRCTLLSVFWGWSVSVVN